MQLPKCNRIDTVKCNSLKSYSLAVNHKPNDGGRLHADFNPVHTNTAISFPVCVWVAISQMVNYLHPLSHANMARM